MGRPRKKGHRDLPPNLYPRRDARRGKTYYQYRHPHTGKFHGLGTDKAAAIRDAKDLNAELAARRLDTRRASILGSTAHADPSPSGITLATWLARYQDLQDRRLEAGEIKPKTHEQNINISNRLRADLGRTPLAALTTRACAQLIDSIAAAGKIRHAQVTRYVLRDALDEAIRAGELQTNPASITRRPRTKIKRKRLTLEDWQAIYQAAHGPEFDPWVANAMLLALVTSHGPAEIAALRFKDHIRDGYMYITRAKNGARIAIPTRLRLDAIGTSVQEAIERCRDRTLSQHLVHHTAVHGATNPGSPVSAEAISRKFRHAREAAGITGENPPTCYEQRSLAERLYKAQGVDTQALLGHKDPRSTAGYHDPRGAEWIRVEAI